MGYFESNLFNNRNWPYISNIKFWNRYVDDILFIWKGEINKLEDFNNFVNKLNTKIKFTLEIEKDIFFGFNITKNRRTDRIQNFS